MSYLTTPESLQPLRDAITHQPPYASGTLPLAPESFVIYYGASKESRRIDLAHADPGELQHLSDSCDRATFGLNHEDVLDETYRKAGKMDISRFSTSIVPERNGLLDIVRANLLDGIDSTRPIQVELYKLNVYSEGSFFKAHKDTPRSESMFGSLVLVFPTPHEGGALILRDDDDEWSFDSAKAVSEQASPSIGFVTFFSDVEHEVLPVVKGHRVTLTFNLYYADIKVEGSTSAPLAPSISSIVPPHETAFRSTFKAFLENPDFLPNGGTLVFGLHHVYPIKNTLRHVPKLLKGSDAIVWRVAHELSLDAKLYLHYTNKRRWHGTARILVPKVPDVKEVNDDFGGFAQELQKNYGGIVILGASYGVKLDEQVNYVTKLTKLSRVTTEYMAYGNESELECSYGDVCMVVRVGKPGSRSDIVTQELKQPEY